jgi:hypothetical protein
MKNILLLLAVMLAVQRAPAQMADGSQVSPVQDGDASYSPIFLFTNGGGQILTFHFKDGQLLQAGRRYSMVAIPDPGFVFANWQMVSVFSFMEITRTPDGSENPPIVSTVTTPVPEYFYRPTLDFLMVPEDMIIDDPGVRIVSFSIGWQANFVPIPPPPSPGRR